MTSAAERTGFAEWVVLELLGHRRLAGYLTEQQIAGASFLRLDVPRIDDARPAVTQLYSPGSVYAITPTTEVIARAVAAGNHPTPVHRWELPAAAASVRVVLDEELPVPEEEDEEPEMVTGPGLGAA